MAPWPSPEMSDVAIWIPMDQNPSFSDVHPQKVFRYLTRSETWVHSAIILGYILGSQMDWDIEYLWGYFWSFFQKTQALKILVGSRGQEEWNIL